MPFKTGSWGEQAKARSVRRREYFRNYRKQRYAKKRDEILSTAKRDYAQNPEKYKARWQAKHHINIPEGQVCEECHAFPATERHHPDYSKPLEVKFLCTGCNRKKS